jgi:hypothetical protein
MTHEIFRFASREGNQMIECAYTVIWIAWRVRRTAGLQAVNLTPKPSRDDANHAIIKIVEL